MMKSVNPDDRSPLDNIVVCGLEDPVIQAWRQLVTTFAKIQRLLEQALAPHGLILSQFEMLARTAIKPGIIQQELAETLLFTKGNVGAMLDRLESLNLIERRPDATDRRVNTLWLTGAGASLVAKLFAGNRKILREIMEPLSGQQLGQLRSLLQLIEPEG